ncbi:hypothetical protein H4R18_000214 [Coemansia javaensis]|uniref:C3H1-type domain-containing protein n=1 Tax=Coemansia javaensis TaxID=2761396 RepID=A0A9W8LNF2_9FUNG|nr:hypothetical protein H4R18_000214 [Coemansia javaensis]
MDAQESDLFFSFHAAEPRAQPGPPAPQCAGSPATAATAAGPGPGPEPEPKSAPRPRPPVPDASPDMIHPLIRNLRLDTPEDIAAWVAERKSKYPTEANIRLKAAAAATATAAKRKHPDASGPLGALAGYGSDSSSGSGSGSGSEGASSDSAPESAPAKAPRAPGAPFRPSTMAPDADRRQLRTCRFFARGSCRRGAACPFAHHAAESAGEQQQQQQKRARPQRATLLEMLMAKDVERENYRVLQCIEYIAARLGC